MKPKTILHICVALIFLTLAPAFAQSINCPPRTAPPTREPNTFGIADTNGHARMIVTTSHPAPYTRMVSVYVPKQSVPGTPAPFIIGADDWDARLGRGE